MHLPAPIISILLLFAHGSAASLQKPVILHTTPTRTTFLTSLSSPRYPPSKYILAPREPEPDPQQTCVNSGEGNSGCNNSGINNSGTDNSGINNCGTGHSGVGEGCDSNGNPTTTYSIAPGSAATAVDGSGYTTVLSGPTSTVTVVVNGSDRRTDCAYWKSQGYTCSGAGRIVGGVGVVLGVAAGVGVWLVV